MKVAEGLRELMTLKSAADCCVIKMGVAGPGVEEILLGRQLLSSRVSRRLISGGECLVT